MCIFHLAKQYIFQAITFRCRHFYMFHVYLNQEMLIKCNKTLSSFVEILDLNE